MRKSLQCTFCQHDFPSMSERCPHCARPGLFPNVTAAEDPSETSALEKRYQTAIQDAASRGCDNVLHDFENVVKNSYAVINRSLREADRIATSDKQLYATYYQLLESQVTLPSGNEWDTLRAVVDEALMPGFKKQIRFAALSLDGVGLSNYGECSLALRENMIAHRASVFEENSVVFMKSRNIKFSEADSLPEGYRATWDERWKLAAAKISPNIGHNTQPADFANLLLSEGATSADDSFVEAHIFGSMTVHTIERVTATRPKGRSAQVFLKSLKERLEKVGVNLEVR